MTIEERSRTPINDGSGVAEGSTPPPPPPPEPKKNKKPVNRRRLIQDDDTEDSPSPVHGPSTLVTASEEQKNLQVTTAQAGMTLPVAVNRGEAGTSSGVALDKMTYEQAIQLAGRFLEMQEQQTRTLTNAQTITSIGSGQTTTHDQVGVRKEASTSSSPTRAVKKPDHDVRTKHMAGNQMQQVKLMLQGIFKERVSLEIQAAAEETLSAAQFYISRRERNDPGTTSTLTSTTIEVT
ncbi:hypothetical protein R1sor_022966 [Riccia sorocarpa]|uniref:Uncharacterized protein n=1 Tax=Riccia sorocarpa TaxID=122646 RepID=A0ABD3GLC0_9MARC